MSAPQQDVSCINDEEVLRRMWQETDDYGRKKEIRTHMYKLREARLSQFYNANESNMATTTEKISTSATATQQHQQTSKKSSQMSTTHHADSLADHSFTQMKAKEIRDSESPTKDLSLVVSDKTLGLSDRAWDRVESKVTTSEDGKTQTISKMATASGTENINDTKLNYAVNRGQQFTTYQDGDDRNFVRGSQSVLKQEAVSASDDGSFRTSSSTHSSSSKFVTKSVNQGDDEVIRTSTNQQQHQQQKQTISEAEIARTLENATLIKTQTSEEPSTTIPNAKTKVTKETFTLPDGTIVTKTRYETRGGDEKLSTEKRSSSSTVQSTKSGKVVSSRTTGDDQVTVSVREIPSETVTSSYRDETSKVSKSHIDRSDQKRFADDVVVTQNTRRDIPVGYDEPDRTSRTDNVVKVTKIIDIEPTCTVEERVSTRTKKDITSKVDQQVTEKIQDVKSSRTVDNKTSTILLTTQDDGRINKTDRRIETSLEDTRLVDRKRPDTVKTDDTHTDYYKTTIIADINVEKPTPDAKPSDRQQPREKSPTKPKEKYPPIDRQKPHKPDKSDLDQKLEPTEGQYETTYRSDYTNKKPSYTDRKIYVEVNPTHEAFARSLRAVSPDRLNRSSTHSLPRSSPSPDKYIPTTRQPSRMSPERKPTAHDRRSTSPRKSPEKFSSNETITYSQQTRQKVCDIDSSTLTRRNKQSPSPPKTVQKRPEVNEIDSSTLTRRPRQPSPTKTVQNTTLIIDLDDRRNRVTEIDSSTLTRRTNKPKQSPTSPTRVTQITDLDTNETVIVPKGSVTTTTVITNNKIKKLQSRSPSSPLSDSSNKSPKETVRKSSLRDISPVKDIRTKTYEERCKEILGINTTKSITKRDSQKSIDLDTTIKSTRLAKKPSQDKLPDGRPVTDKNLPSDEDETIRTSDKQRLDQFSDLNSSIEYISTVVDKKHTTEDFLNTERKDETKVSKTITTEEYDTTQKFLANESIPQKNLPREQSPKREYPDEVEPKACSRSTPEIDYLDKVLEKHTPIEITVRIPGLPHDKQKSPESTSTVNAQSRKSETRTDVRTETDRRTTKSPDRKSPERTKPGTNQRPSSKPRSTPDEEPTKKTVITNGFTVVTKRPSPDKEYSKQKWDQLKTRTTKTSDSTEIIKKNVERERKSPERHIPTNKVRPTPDRETVDKPWRQTSPSGKSPEKTSPVSRPRSSPEKDVERRPTTRQRSPVEESPRRKSPEKVVSPTKWRKSPENVIREKPLRPTAVNKTSPERAEPINRQRSPVNELPRKKSPEKATLPSKPRPSPETDRIDRKPVEEIPRRKSPERTSPVRSGPRTTSKGSFEETVTSRTTVTEKLPEKPGRKSPDETFEIQETDQTIVDELTTRRDEKRRVSTELSINLTTDQKSAPGKPSVRPRESPERKSPEKVREKPTTDDNVCQISKFTSILSPERRKPTEDTIVGTEEVIVISDSSSETEEEHVRRTEETSTQKTRAEEVSRIYPQPRKSPEKKHQRPTGETADVRKTTKVASVTKPESSESETDEDEIPTRLKEIKIEKTEVTVDTGLLRKHPVPVPDETISITQKESTTDTSRLKKTSLDTENTSKVSDVVITSILKTSKDKRPTNKNDTPSIRKQPETSKPSPVEIDETISITEEEIVRTTDEKEEPRRTKPVVQETVTVTTSTIQTSGSGKRPVEDDTPTTRRGPDSRKALNEKSPVQIDEIISITEEEITTTLDKKRKIVDSDEVTDEVTTCRVTRDKKPTKDDTPSSRKVLDGSRPMPGRVPVQVDETITITEENVATTLSEKRKSVDTDKITDAVVTSCSRTTSDKKPTEDDKPLTRKSPDTSKPLPGRRPVQTDETVSTTEEHMTTTADKTTKSSGKTTDTVTTSISQTSTSDKRPTKDDTKKGPVSGKPSPQTRQSPERVITKIEKPSDSEEDSDEPRSPSQPRRPWEETQVRREYPRTTDFTVETDLPRKRPSRTQEIITDKITDTVETSSIRITSDRKPTDNDKSPTKKGPDTSKPSPGKRPVQTDETVSTTIENLTTTSDKTVKSSGKITDTVTTSVSRPTTGDRRPTKDDAPSTKKGPVVSGKPSPQTRQSPGRVITRIEGPSDSEEDLESPRSPSQPRKPWEETTVRREQIRTTDSTMETNLPKKRPSKTEEVISITTEKSVVDRDVCSRVQKTEISPKDRQPLEKTTTTGLVITSILKTTTDKSKPSKDDTTPTKKRPDRTDQPVPKTEQSPEEDIEKTSEKQGTYLQKYLEAAMKAKTPPQKEKPKVSRLLENEPPKSRKPVADTVQPRPNPETRNSPDRVMKETQDITEITSTTYTNKVDKTKNDGVSKTRITGKRTPAQPKPKPDSGRSPDRTTKETRHTITEVSHTIDRKNRINETRNRPLPKEPKPKHDSKKSPDRATTKRTQPITEISNTTYKACKVNGVKDDEIVKKKITTVSATNNQENRIPVEEPPFTKKHIKPLGPGDEKVHKTVKKDLSRSEPYRRPQTKKPVLIDEIIIPKPKAVQTVSRNKPETQKPGAVIDTTRKSSIKTETTRTTLTGTVNSPVVSTPTSKPSSIIEKKPVSARVPEKPSTKASTVKIAPTKITRLPSDKPTKPVQDDETSSNASSTEQFIEETRRDWTTTEDDVRTNKKIVVNLRRSKSSKESSPDRICPLPVSSIDSENAPPRYPDEIQEPEDDDSKPRKIFAIQEDHVTEHANIREIDEEHEDEKHSLSVSQKINKFITEAEQLTAPKKIMEITKGSRNVPRSTDGSVLEKISLFTTKAGNVDDEFIKREQEREINSRTCVDKKDSTKTINLTMIDVKPGPISPDKFARVSPPRVNATEPDKLSRVSRPSAREPEPGRISPERRARVSPPRVKESEPGRASPEKLHRVCPPSAISPQKFVKGSSSPSPKDQVPGRTSPEKLYRVSPPDAREQEPGRVSPERFVRVSTPGRTSPERLNRTSAPSRVKEPASLTSIELLKNISSQRTKVVELDQETEDRPSTPKTGRRPSDEGHKHKETPKLFDSTSVRTDRRSSDESQRTRESTYQHVSDSTRLYESTPKTGRRPSGDRQQTEDVPVSESSKVKCAKALFETTPERRETYRPRNILERPSVLESKRLIDEEIRKSTTTQSTKESLRSSSIERTSEIEDRETGFVRERSPGSSDDQLPGYMRPLDRSLRANSPHRESIGQFKKTTSEDRDSTVQTRVVTAQNGEENVILGKSKITEEEIERIYELEILEELLKVVIGYDLRKKLREQIRLVKRMTEEELQIRRTQIINEERIYNSKNVTENRNVQVRRTSSERLNQSHRRTSLTKETDSTVVQKNSRSPQVDRTSRVVVTRRKSPSPSKDTGGSTNVTTTSSCTRTGSYSNQVVSSTRSSKPNQEDKVRVQGTVIRSQYYSENDDEPQVTVTKYSYDSNDMDQPTKDRVIANVSINSTRTNADEVNLSLGDVLTNEKDFVQTVEESLDNELVTQRTSKRRGSVKALSKKFIKNAVETSKSERQSSYPKAGLILRTSSFKESSTANKSRKGSETSRSKVVTRASPARTTKNEINRTSSSSAHHHVESSSSTTHRSSSSRTTTSSTTSSSRVVSSSTSGGIAPQSKALVVKGSPIAAVGNSEEKTTRTKTTKTVFEQHADYQEHSKFQTRVRKVMAEQEGCIETAATEENAESPSSSSGGGTTTTSKSTSATSAVEAKTESKTSTPGPLTISEVTTTKVSTTEIVPKKPISPFAKFRQLDKQNSLNTPPSTPQTPSGSGPLFKFTDPALNQSASTIKDRLLYWCKMKTKEYENIQLDNFSTSWADGLAFCALIHHFLPDAFDYHALSPKNRRYNFTLAFQVADEKADIAPLLDVDDMVATRKPDWKCVFTYVQSIYRRFKNED